MPGRVSTVFVAVVLSALAVTVPGHAKDPWKHYYKQQEKEAKSYYKYQRKQAKAWEKYERKAPFGWSPYRHNYPPGW